ncbi:DUF262 domain-containing protein [Synechocystis sp. PCC 7339]|uniref:DUF262 domain-containing protein n=1 Tax=unclassified Synechocystis TaxID=2640012 RepID=UPI001BB07F99|nr:MULTISPECIES: DUF262 domain-containing protein [unclassified Synechocystis]QUS60605.1 DUF262 domain-containing protein [Synechocystis sp. PCC 7338]UAJ71950.1 DUF262 domain-containing protein [Synechocystis sp. PCC 7339]
MPVGQDFVEQLRKVRVSKKVITRKIGDVISDFQSAKIIIPTYQRSFVWPIDKQNRFIESIFMDIPIPPLFFLEKYDEEKEMVVYEIIDGVQRITTLCNFINGQLKPSDLENLPHLNQAKFQTLPANISNLFFERELTNVVIESNTHPEIQFEVFGRLNMGSVSLNSQELRNCMFHGEFNDFLKDLNKNRTYRELLDAFPRLKPAPEGKPDKNRMFDVELILRLFTLYDFYNQQTKQYPESRSEILNDYMRKRIDNDPSVSSQEELESLFIRLLEMVKICFNGNQFKSFNVKPSKNYASFSKQLNAAVFDVQMLGFVDYQINEILDKAEVIYDAFIDLCSFDRDFSDSIIRSTNSKVNGRLTPWKQTLKSIVENYDSYLSEFLEKKEAFNSTPICKVSGEEILSFEECDYCDGKIYHKSNSPKLELRRSSTRNSMKTDAIVSFGQKELEYSTLEEAIQFLIDHISEKILSSDDPHHIERLKSLSFIGTSDELLERIPAGRSGKRIAKMGDLYDSNRHRLYINISGGRKENIDNFNQLFSLFSFTQDVKIK